MRTLNLGILAHVDAGKTSLTERLLYAAGVIDAVGSVDRGTTQTDTLALERERGITIKSAVVSFEIGATRINLFDTPGHPDFIAEVDRVLGLLDGAVLVVSAVEGVQPQTRVLWRALRRLGVPTLIFVNKIDRLGADLDRTLTAIRRRLSTSALGMTVVADPGTRAATAHRRAADEPAWLDEVAAIVSEYDEQMLSRYVGDELPSAAAARRAVERWSRRGAIHPVFAGSAITGAGVEDLVAGIARLLPSTADSGPSMATGADPGAGCTDPAGDSPRAVVFKIERSESGERTALARIVRGTLRPRTAVRIGDVAHRPTAIEVFDRGQVERCEAAGRGRIVRIHGLGAVRIGDWIGDAPAATSSGIAPPQFSAVVTPGHARDRHRLHTALEALAAEDPLIDLRFDEVRGELAVSLHGEVQRQVIAETLAREFGLVVEFSDTTTICVERLAGTGEAVERQLGPRSQRRPFLAGVGLRVTPGRPGDGVTFSPGLEPGRLPAAFVVATEEAVRATLGAGLAGWEIPDCAVEMTASNYWPRQSRAHGTFDKNMSSTAGDFRLLTPLVLVEALRRAGTVVHEPVHRFRLEVPAATIGPVAGLLSTLAARVEATEPYHDDIVLTGLLPAVHRAELSRRLPGLTAGDGTLDAVFDSYLPVKHTPPTRPRPTPDPLHRQEYLRSISDRL